VERGGLVEAVVVVVRGQTCSAMSRVTSPDSSPPSSPAPSRRLMSDRAVDSRLPLRRRGGLAHRRTGR
jgi:hypothetical protein